MSGVTLVGYFTLFVFLAVALVFGALLLGKLLRPNNPTPIKRETYECGEPAVGSSDIQFDIRFYVVALVFLIFDVEVAVFFPWATVFGKATHIASATSDCESRQSRLAELGFAGAIHPGVQLEKTIGGNKNSLGSPLSEQSGSHLSSASPDQLRTWGRRLAGMALCDILVFFGILMVGFAYVWFKGDLTWVRAVPQTPGLTIRTSFGPSENTSTR